MYKFSSICTLILCLIMIGLYQYDFYKNLLKPFAFTNVLILINILTRYIICKYYKNWEIASGDYTYHSIIGIGIIIPIFEECIFRFTMQKNLEYYLTRNTSRYIVMITFALTHILNILVPKIQTTLKKTLIMHIICQMVFAFILGYILSMRDSLLLSIIFHIYYNIVSIILLLKIAANCEPIQQNNDKKRVFIKKRSQSFPIKDRRFDHELFPIGTMVNQKVYDKYNEMTKSIYLFEPAK